MRPAAGAEVNLAAAADFDSTTSHKAQNADWPRRVDVGVR